MPINPNIALSGQAPQIDVSQFSPVNQMAKFAQMQNFAQEGRLNALKIKQAEAEAALDPTSTDYANQLLKVNPTKGREFLKLQLEAENAKATRAKTDIETAAAKQKMLAQSVRDISQRPSDANITAWMEDIQESPLFNDADKAAVTKRTQQLLSMPFPDRVVHLSSQGASASELRPVTNVGPTGVIQTPAFGGAATVVPGTEAAFQMTPAQIAQNKIAQQQLAVSQGQLGVSQGQLKVAQEREGRQAMNPEGIAPKDMQKREAVFPEATASIKGFESKSDSFISDLKKLRDHPGLDQITGMIAGRAPAVTAEGRAAQALYDKVVAKGGFQALQDLRSASKTGGALGNVSNTEGKQLTASFAAIDRKQDAPDVRASIDQAISDIEGSKTRMREAYDTTYSYKQNQPAKPAAPAAKTVTRTGTYNGRKVVQYSDGSTEYAD